MGNVIEIGVYGLNESLVDRVEACCNEVFFKRNIGYRLNIINPESFEEKHYDILFVKIENVMEKLADKVKKFADRIKGLIVAIADTIESLLFAFKINTYRAFLDKSSNDEICDILNGAIDNMFQNEKVCIKTKEQKKMMPLKEILYVEAIGDGSVVVTEKEQIYTTKSLKYWQEKFANKNFYRCHKSFLIALKNIKDFKNDVVIFESVSGKHNVMVSVRKRAELKRLAF